MEHLISSFLGEDTGIEVKRVFQGPNTSEGIQVHENEGNRQHASMA